MNEARNRRDVRWWYRHYLHDPPASKRELADAYVNEARMRGVHLSADQHDTVSKAIARVEAVLSRAPIR